MSTEVAPAVVKDVEEPLAPPDDAELLTIENDKPTQAEDERAPAAPSLEVVNAITTPFETPETAEGQAKYTESLAQSSADVLAEALQKYYVEQHIDEERASQVAAKLVEHDISGPVLLSLDPQKLDKDLSDSALGFEVSSYGMRVMLLRFRSHVLQLHTQSLNPGKRSRSGMSTPYDQPSHKRRGVDMLMSPDDPRLDPANKKSSRRYQKWSAQETEALESGVTKYGGCKWAAILSDPEYADTLKARSQGDLSDKWRGLKKRQRASADGRGRGRTEGEEAVDEEHILGEGEENDEDVGNAEQERVEVEPNEEEIAMEGTSTNPPPPS